MGRDTFVYMATNEDMRLKVGLTKDFEYQRSMQMLDPDGFKWMVYVERWPTLDAASTRVVALRKMSTAKRRGLINKANPGWFQLDESGNPARGYELAQRTQSGYAFGVSVRQPEHLRSNDDEGGAHVDARLPRGPRPPRNGEEQVALPTDHDQQE